MTSGTGPDPATIVAAIDRAPVGITVSDPAQPDNPIVYANEGFAEITGYPADEVIGRNCRFLQGEDTDPETVARIREAVAAEEPVTVELLNYTADDEPFWNQLRIAPVGPAGEVTHFVGFQVDVTERRRREAAMTALNEATDSLMDAADREAVARIAVDTAERALDCSLVTVWLADDDGVLRPAASADAAHELFDELPTFAPGEGLAGAAFESGDVQVFDDVSDEPGRITAETPIGSEVILPLGEHGVLIAGAEEAGAFDALDVSLARTLAAVATSALERADREATLREQQERLEAQNERLDEFASIVGHDLRNPLNVAQGRLDLARTEVDSDHLDDVAEAQDRMAALIDDLLDLARRGEEGTEQEAVALADLVSHCWETVDTGPAGLAIETELTVVADRSRLRQLIENLLRNAIEHAGPDVRVTVGDLPDGFYVADDGPGIPPDERERVMEQGVTTSEDGTGLGLGIVREVAEAHGWSVEVGESDAGGARFAFSGVELA
jgi:PAS domain S-box-containing protein